MYERMTSGWSHKATQRSTSASSSSSISSKWRFATPSLLKGHSLSEGWSSGECDGKNSRCMPSLGPLACSLRYAIRPDRLPAGCVFSFPLPLLLLRSAPKPTRTPVRSRWVGSASGPLRYWGARRHREVAPLVSLVDLHERSSTDGAPYLAHDRLRTQTGLVLAPQLYLGRRVALLEPHHPHRELFLKASCSCSSARA